MRVGPGFRTLVGAAALSLVLAGCGGDDEEAATTPQPATTPSAVESVPTTTPTDTAAADKAEAETAKERRATQRRLRADEAKRVLEGVVIAMELETVAVTTSEGGRVLTVALEHQSACRLDEESADALRRGVKAAAPEVKRVRLRGEKSRKQALTRYQDERCLLRTNPRAAKIVLERTDGGDALFEGIVVGASPWELEYGSSAKRFRLTVIDERDRTVLSLGKPGPGNATRRVPRGGRFTIRISSTGRWTVRVRDGT